MESLAAGVDAMSSRRPLGNTGGVDRVRIVSTSMLMTRVPRGVGMLVMGDRGTTSTPGVSWVTALTRSMDI
jgi:hypothetical protein